MRRYEQPERLPPNLLSTRYYLFDGGCVVYRFSFADDADVADARGRQRPYLPAPGDARRLRQLPDGPPPLRRRSPRLRG